MTTQTIIGATWEFGSSGPYCIGIEYCIDYIDDSLVYHVVLRPLRDERFLGYGIGDDGYEGAIMHITSSDEWSEWRCGRERTSMRVIRAPSTPMSIPTVPDEDGVDNWGDPVRIPDETPERWTFLGRDITEARARELLAGYASERTV